MFNKLYVKTKKFIKENFIFLIVLTIIYLTLTFPLPYYIYNGGGILSLEDRIEIENKELKQDINLSYVNQLKGNVGTYLLSYIIPHWDKEKIEDTEYDYEEELYRNKIMLEESINNATINAYKEAGKDYEVIGEKVLVTYIFKEAKTNLEVGDQIIKVNDMIIHNADEFMEIINSSEIGDKINIEVMSKEEKQTKTAEIVDYKEEKKTAIGILTNYILETDPEVEIKFKANEAGPSGGLMLTVGIYDKLTNSKLSDNRKICGTGTIDKDGNVGEIGGVKYKLQGAVKNKCDIFIAPSDNYEEVLKEIEKNNYKIKTYEAKTFKETLEYLKSTKK